MTTTGLQYKNREARFAAGLSYKRAIGRGEAHYETADGPLQMPDMRGLYRSMDSRRIDAQRFPRWGKTSGGLSKPMLKRAQIIFEVIDW